jgi:hypothetical protein
LQQVRISRLNGSYTSTSIYVNIDTTFIQSNQTTPFELYCLPHTVRVPMLIPISWKLQEDLKRWIASCVNVELTLLQELSNSRSIRVNISHYPHYPYISKSGSCKI